MILLNYLLLYYIMHYMELLICAIIFISLDIGFISLNNKIYADQVISVQRTALTVKPVGAIMCYLFLVSGLYYFIIRKHESPWTAFLLGLFVYGVFETTSYAILKNWKIQTVIIDTLWGGVLMAATTWITYKLIK